MKLVLMDRGEWKRVIVYKFGDGGCIDSSLLWDYNACEGDWSETGFVRNVIHEKSSIVTATKKKKEAKNVF